MRKTNKINPFIICGLLLITGTLMQDDFYCEIKPSETLVFSNTPDFVSSKKHHLLSPLYGVQNNKQPAQAPDAPELESVTSYSLTVRKVAGNEYSIDNCTSWQSDNEFNNLEPNQSYEIYARREETIDNYASPASAKPLIVTTDKGTLDAPNAPQLDGEVSSTSFSVIEIFGAVYSINEEVSWQSSVEFTNLLPNTTYRVFAKYPETNNYYESQSSAPTLITTNLGTQEAPNPPELVKRTDTSIIIKEITGAVYKIDGLSDWQDSATFSNLTPNTEYTIMVKLKATSNHYESVAVSGQFRTDKVTAQAPIALEIDENTTTTIKVKEIAGAVYKIESVTDWQDSNVFSELTPNTEYTIKAKIKATIDKHESAEISAKIKTDKITASAPNAPELNIRTDTKIEVKEIAGAVYRIQGLSDWQDSNTFNGLSPNTEYTVLVKIKETSNNYESVEVSTVMKTDKATLETPKAPNLISATDTQIVVQLIAGALYKIEGVTNWQVSNTFNDLSPNSDYTVLVKLAGTDDVYESAAAKAVYKTLKTAQNAPSAPELIEATATRITIKEIAYAMYRIDGLTNWQESNTFSGLSPNTEYKVSIKIKEHGIYSESPIVTQTFKTDKLTAKTPTDLTLVNVTTTSITVNKIAGAVYRIDGVTTWQNSNIFEGLSPNIEYKIIAKIAATNDIHESAETSILIKTSKTAPAAPASPTLNGLQTATSITINHISGAEYSINNGMTWQDSNTFEGLAPNTQYSIIARIKETADHAISQSSTALVVTTLRIPSATPGAPILSEVTTMSITVVPILNAEYSIDGGATWQDSNVFEELTPNTEYSIILRIKETNDFIASLASTALVTKTDKTAASVPDTPTLDGTPTSNSITVKAIPNTEYSIDGGTTWQDSGIFTNLDANTEYTILARTKATATTNASSPSVALVVKTASNKMPTAIIVLIVVVALFILSIGSFAFYWFVISKKTLKELLSITKKQWSKVAKFAKNIFSKKDKSISPRP